MNAPGKRELPPDPDDDPVRGTPEVPDENGDEGEDEDEEEDSRSAGPDPQTIGAVPDAWPHRAAVVGEIYGFYDGEHGHNMIAMHAETWTKVFADIATLKQRLDQLSAENIEYRQGRTPDGAPKILQPNGFYRRLVS